MVQILKQNKLKPIKVNFSEFEPTKNYKAQKGGKSLYDYSEFLRVSGQFQTFKIFKTSEFSLS